MRSWTFVTNLWTEDFCVLACACVNACKKHFRLCTRKRVHPLYSRFWRRFNSDPFRGDKFDLQKSTQNSRFWAVFPAFIRYSRLTYGDTLARLCLVYHSRQDGSRGCYALRPKYSQISKSKNDSFFFSIAEYRFFPITTWFVRAFLVFWHTAIFTLAIFMQKYCGIPILSYNYVIFAWFFGIPQYRLGFTYFSSVLRNTDSFP